MRRRALFVTGIRWTLTVALLWAVSYHAHWSTTLALALLFARCEAIDLLIELRRHVFAKER